MRASLAAVVMLLIGCATGGQVEGVTEDAVADSSRPDTMTTAESAAPDTSVALDTATPPDTSMGVDTTMPVDMGPMCGPGQKWCGTFCASIGIDTEHCGDCNAKCPDVANADRTCVAGKCGFTCRDPYAQCGADTACTTNIANNPAHCGACGKACPSGPTTTAACASKTCSSSCKSGYVSLGGSCTNFGGFFESNGAGCAACNNGNPYAGGGCACPSGTTAGGAISLHNDCAGVRPATMQVCESSGAAAGVWGGVYQADDAVGCSVACRVANARTGGCSCPAGYSAVSLRVLVKTSCGGIIGSNVIACTHPSLALDNYGGVYEQDDPVPGGVGCRVSNPRTGGCSCPSGFSASSYRTIVDAGGGMIGAVISVCSR